jgi:hypothetical protein
LTGNLLAGWVHELFEGEFSPTFAVATIIAAVMAGMFLIGFKEHRPTI